MFVASVPALPFPVPVLPLCADDDERGEWLTRLVARGDGELVLGDAPPAPLTRRLHSNASGVAVVASVCGRRYVVPPYGSFALSPACLLRALPLGRFTLLILDPPWECASATRRCVGGATGGCARRRLCLFFLLNPANRLLCRGAYASMSPAELADLPIRSLCEQSGALVAIWCVTQPCHFCSAFSGALL